MMNWRQIYGDAEFSLRPPIYWSDIVRRRNRRNVDLDDLKKKAEAYAKVQLMHCNIQTVNQGQCAANSIDYEEVIKGETELNWPPMKKEIDLEARVERDDQRRAAQIKTETAATGTHRVTPV